MMINVRGAVPVLVGEPVDCAQAERMIESASKTWIVFIFHGIPLFCLTHLLIISP